MCSYLSTGLYVVDPEFQVGLVIGKGGETIKSMQARTGARIQVGSPVPIAHPILFIKKRLGCTFRYRDVCSVMIEALSPIHCRLYLCICHLAICHRRGLYKLMELVSRLRLLN